jgi:hypothetical protein
MALVNVAENAMPRILCFLCFLLFQDETNAMHPLFAEADRLFAETIGAAIELRPNVGPGLNRRKRRQRSMGAEPEAAARPGRVTIVCTTAGGGRPRGPIPVDG